METDLAVIGAGPAGIMTALQAAKAGVRVVLLERNQRIGRKLAITGSGRCNLTNQSSLEEIIGNIPGNGRFLYSVLRRFGPEELMALFEKEFGVALKVERGHRVFPESDQAHDIVRALQKALTDYGVTLWRGRRVLEIDFSGAPHVFSVQGEKGLRLDCRYVAVATGGASYPATGSSGDGYRLARAAGHQIITPQPALVPLETKESWAKQLQGLSLTNVAVSAWHRGRKLQAEFGEMLFTHFGVSGPIILSLSREIVQRLANDPGSVKLLIDLKPALNETQLDLRLQRDFAKYIRKIYQNSLDELLPKKMIPVIVGLSGIDPSKPVHQITKEERLRLVHLLKNLELTITQSRPLAEAIVTAGGVSTKEIDPKTMESKIVPGLYFVGEVVDVDGYTGGFNLQIAFSMGYAAGRAIAARLAASKEFSEVDAVVPQKVPLV